MMITNHQISEHVKTAELRFNKCWEIFDLIKFGKFDNNSGDKLVLFQPMLAEAIHDLSTLYRELSQEKEYLITRKQYYNSKWFNDKMKSTASRMDLVRDIIAIGKTLGDAFVLFFYQNDGQYLSEHLAHEDIPFSPPGLGGIGELEFVKNIKHINGYMCLYHGITNILRLGDISLIDLREIKVVGIGEIKTHNHENGQLNLSILISGPGLHFGKNQPLKQPQTQFKSIPIPAQYKFEDRQISRIKRQLGTISKSFKRLTSSPDGKMSIEHDGFYGDFNVFVKQIRTHKMYCKKLSNGMIIIGFKIFNKTLYTKHTTSGSVDYSKKIIGIEKLVYDTLIPNRNDNSIMINSFFYSRKGKTHHYPGMSHLVWWPLDIDIIRKIIFKDIFIMTIYNPAHFYQTLENAGYTIVFSKSSTISAYKQIGNMRFEIRGFNYYIDMIVNNLFTEESILSILKGVEENSKNIHHEQPMKIEIYIQQILGVPYT